MKRLLLPLLAALALPTAVNADHNPFATKPRYGHDPFYRESLYKKKLTDSERKALNALCKIGLNAEGKIWDNDDINAAISSISWGRHWPDTARATAYKTCDRGGYLN
tara:strand:- start:652 stop:972 length:321 start_codon:yes stop_codon:yes gene_type:complete